MNPMHPMNHRKSRAAGFAIAALGLFGFGSAQADNSPLRIGILSPSTGVSAYSGLSFEQAARQMLEPYVRNGMHGHPVKFTFYDTEGASPKAAQLFNRLIDNDDVHVVIGPVNSGESLGAAPVAAQRKVPMLCVCSAEAITKPVNPYVFGIAPVDATVTSELLDVLKSHGIKRAALIYSLDAFGQSGGKMLEAKAKDFGIDLVAIETFAPQDTNMTPQLLKIRDKAPDAIMLWSAANPAPAIIMKTIKELGIKHQIYLGNAAAFNNFTESAGAAADGAYVTSLPILAPDVLPEGDKRKVIVSDFVKSFKGRWNTLPEQTAGGAMDAVLILDAAVKQISGQISRDALRDAIEKVSMCGAYGCRQFTAEDHRGHGKQPATVLMQIKDSKWVAIRK